MGEVYRARDTRLDRTVALKILPERANNTTMARERFERGLGTLPYMAPEQLEGKPADARPPTSSPSARCCTR